MPEVFVTDEWRDEAMEGKGHGGQGPQGAAPFQYVWLPIKNNEAQSGKKNIDKIKYDLDPYPEIRRRCQNDLIGNLKCL